MITNSSSLFSVEFLRSKRSPIVTDSVADDSKFPISASFVNHKVKSNRSGFRSQAPEKTNPQWFSHRVVPTDLAVTKSTDLFAVRQ